MQNNSLKTEPIREDTSGMSHKLKVQYWPIDDVHPYPNNPRHNDEAVEYVANSIREFGWQQPIVVDTDGTIIAGHTRHKAAKLLGMDTVPVVVAENLTPAQVNAYRLADNKTSEAATWDMEALSVELEGLEIDFDMTDFGFDTTEFSFASESVEVVEDEVPEGNDVPTVCERGDVWILGDHKLMCGDSSDMGDISILVAGGGSPTMVFTDPPYGVAIGDKNKMLESVQKSGMITENIIGDTLSTEELYDLLVKCFTNLREVCDESCSYYVSSPQGGEIGLMMMMMRDAGLPVRHNLIWAKNSATFSMGRLDYDYKHEPIFYTWTKRHNFYGENQNTLLEFDKPRANKLHPTMKPVALVARLMENSSRPKDTVMDIFGGSGTTLIAAEQLGRKCLMMELDPHYCDVIIARWEELTGRKAVKANG